MAISASCSRLALLAACLGSLAATVAAAPAEAPPAPAGPPAMTLGDAVRIALEQNPEIAAVRQQRGVVAAGVMIARAYPFNPVWEGRFRYAWPVFEGASNQEPVESTVLLEMELRGQGRHRKAAAAAALSRTDWEIAAQELFLVVRVIRAFDAVVYRFQKNKLVLDTIALNQEAVDKAPGQVEAKTLLPVDEIILRTELEESRATLGQTRTALAVASSELRSALGMVGGDYVLQGDLSAPPPPADPAAVLADAAQQTRPDRQAREAALAEAEARLRLERANRFGNPTLGPTYEYDNSSIHNIGVQFALPLPVLNAHRGDILQREAERQRAAFDLRQTDIEIAQEVEAALSRLKQARSWAEAYQKSVVNLEDSLKKVRQLFDSGDKSVDALRILDVQRKMLKARDGYLDAQFEVRQAMADLAAALGDPSVAVGCRPAQ
jgi:cobalt-zinc-cadmium efflux system outer membrane protein